MIRNSLKILLVAGTLTVAMPLFAAPAREGVVKGSYIHLRKENKFNSPIIGKKMRGDGYKILFEEKNWLKVSFSDGLEGWLYKTLVEQAPDKSVKPAEDKTASATPEARRTE